MKFVCGIQAVTRLAIRIGLICRGLAAQLRVIRERGVGC